MYHDLRETGKDQPISHLLLITYILNYNLHNYPGRLMDAKTFKRNGFRINPATAIG